MKNILAALCLALPFSALAAPGIQIATCQLKTQPALTFAVDVFAASETQGYIVLSMPGSQPGEFSKMVFPTPLRFVDRGAAVEADLAMETMGASNISMKITQGQNTKMELKGANERDTGTCAFAKW